MINDYRWIVPTCPFGGGPETGEVSLIIFGIPGGPFQTAGPSRLSDFQHLKVNRSIDCGHQVIKSRYSFPHVRMLAHFYLFIFESL